MEKDEEVPRDPLPQNALVVVFSYHHRNTEKIAHVIAEVLGAPVKIPKQVRPDEISDYDLVGFGSGIYSATFDASLLDLADRLPQVTDKNVFLFSTYGAPAFVATREFVEKNHAQIRKNSRQKGTRSSVNSGLRGGTRTVSYNISGVQQG